MYFLALCACNCLSISTLFIVYLSCFFFCLIDSFVSYFLIFLKSVYYNSQLFINTNSCDRTHCLFSGHLCWAVTKPIPGGGRLIEVRLYSPTRPCTSLTSSAYCSQVLINIMYLSTSFKSCLFKVDKNGCNNVVLATLFIVVNNIVKHFYTWLLADSNSAMLNNIVTVILLITDNFNAFLAFFS